MVRQGGGIGKVVWYRLARVGQVVGEGGGVGKVVREGHPGKASLGVLAEGETSGQWGRRGNVRQLEKKDFIISKRVLDEHVCTIILGIWGLEIMFFVVVDIYDEADHWIKSQP